MRDAVQKTGASLPLHLTTMDADKVRRELAHSWTLRATWRPQWLAKRPGLKNEWSIPCSRRVVK
jgi:hypothetical protein